MSTVLALLALFILPFVFVFCLAYAIKFLLNDETIYFVICAAGAALSLMLLHMIH